MATVAVATPAPAAAPIPNTNPSNNNPNAPWPVFDLFLDVPHPAASSSCPPPFWIPAASSVDDPQYMQELQKSLPQIGAFCFPEYAEGAQPQQPQPQQQSQQQQQQLRLNRFDVYASERQPFQSFSFSLQLGNGGRVFGHVRRYLPPQLEARSRYDVGRRGERALVILTRATGATALYSSLLATLEAVQSHQASLDSYLQVHASPQKWLLHHLHHHQQHLSRMYQLPEHAQHRGIPLVASLEGLELGHKVPTYTPIDACRFMLPTSLLIPASSTASNTTASLLPLLRCVGVAHALRLLAALLSERRIILTSHSPTRLAACSQAALAMLAQGLLVWQHLYIPVLPPHLWPYLAAPYPYLIGILQTTASSQRLDQTDGLGDVLILHLDTNQMETRGMDAAAIQQRLPDLFAETTADSGLTGGPNSGSAVPTPTELLGQEWSALVKADKKAMYGESTMDKVGETAAKATKAVTKTFSRLKNKGKAFLQKRGVVDGGAERSSTPPPPSAEEEPPDAKSMAPDYILIESCHNETAEEGARVALTVFFLCLYGDVRWYLSPGTPLPVFDGAKLLASKRQLGQGPGTPIWPLLQNFAQTQMLLEFSKARIDEIQHRRPLHTPDTPLFLQCSGYHRHHQVGFDLANVHKVCKQMAASMQARQQAAKVLPGRARQLAMSLTSNKPYESDYARAVAALVEECRECTMSLADVMSVLWLRLRDSRGMQWKHGQQALQVLRQLLYHGPLAVVAHATDGLQAIRHIKNSYDNLLRPQMVQPMRLAAQEVYTLLSDRARLFRIRRACAQRRWQLRHPNSRTLLIRDKSLWFTVPFHQMHAGLHPQAQLGTIVQLPPPVPAAAAPPPPMAAVVPPPQAMVAPTPQPPMAAATPPPATPSEDLMGLFGNMAVAAPAPPPVDNNPFADFVAKPDPPGEGQQPQPPSTDVSATTPPTATVASTAFPTSTAAATTGPGAVPDKIAFPQQQQRSTSPVPPPQQQPPAPTPMVHVLGQPMGQHHNHVVQGQQFAATQQPSQPRPQLPVAQAYAHGRIAQGFAPPQDQPPQRTRAPNPFDPFG